MCSNGRIIKSKTFYALRNNKEMYASGLKCWNSLITILQIYLGVNVEDLRYNGIKSHDCHVFMERLLPVIFRNLLPNPIWDILIEISYFFRDICTTVIWVDHMETLERNIIETLHKHEKIFPLEFFDSMEHLLIHLAYEVNVGGLV